MAKVETVELIPLHPEQIAALQRKAERHKAALAKLEQALASTKRRLQKITEEYRIAEDALILVREALIREGITEAIQRIEHALFMIITGTPEARAQALAAARKRDTTLFTLREKVSELHRALARARQLIQNITPDSADMQQITQALG